MIQKTQNIIWLAIASSAMSFFGYVYEAIVDVPNMFGIDPVSTKIMWTDYHSITNPIHYHVIPSLIALVAIVILWLRREQLSVAQATKLKTAIITTIIANILTGIAVTQLNDKLYFGAPIQDAAIVTNLALWWSVVNFIRLSVVGVCLVVLVRMLK